jgi:hypothetical protein
VPERLFPLFGCLCHALEKDRRAFYWRRLTGTINFPPPGLLGSPSPLHDKRIVCWVKFFTHALLNGDGRIKFQTKTVDLNMKAALPTTLQASDSDGGVGVQMTFRRIIVYPGGREEIEGVTQPAPAPDASHVLPNEEDNCVRL